ncbi:MAG TPA: aldo/keto reductase [Anaerolineae bacterium]
MSEISPAVEAPGPVSAETVELGRTGLYVSPLGLGTWAWGDRMTWGYGAGYGADDLKAAFRASLAAGINFFDTAEIYGRGQSETFLGQFIQGMPRRLVTVATKFMPYRPLRSSLEAALRASLDRLQLSQVDLYQIHFPLPPRSIETWISALADVMEQGLTRAVGVSNFSLQQTRQAAAVLRARGMSLASNQMQFSLFDRRIESNGLLDYCREQGITVIAYSPLAKGLATGKYTPENPPPGIRGRQYNRRYLARALPLLMTLREIAAQRGVTPGQVALNWTIGKGTLPIPGAKNERQAQDNAGALGWRLDAGEMAELDRVSGKL